MSFSDTFAPNGGRQIDTSHGAVTGSFRRYFVPGTACALTSMSLNGVAVTLADFGLDIVPEPGVPFYIGKDGDSITAINLSAGKAFLPYASDQVRPDA